MSRQPPPLGAAWGTDRWDASGSPEELAETRRLLATIPGGGALLARFDERVTFHDAEVVAIHLDREGVSRLELAAAVAGGWVRVTFELTDWIDAHIAGFSHQNVIGQLLLREPEDREVEAWEKGVGMASGDHEITLTPIFGAHGSIRATVSNIAVTEFLDKRPRAGDQLANRR